jgi:hypothetical protein
MSKKTINLVLVFKLASRVEVDGNVCLFFAEEYFDLTYPGRSHT